MSRSLVPILGGTFDPVHNGHLRCALEIAEWLDTPVRLLPSSQPAHRSTPGASAALRLAMLEAATQGHQRLIVDDRELRREGATYSVDTLETLHAELPGAAFAFILGEDAFAGLPGWHRWEDVLELTHFVLVRRPGHDRRWPAELADWARERRTDHPEALREARGGRLIVPATTPLEVSATQLRALVRAGRDPAFLVPGAVRDMILAQQIYA